MTLLLSGEMVQVTGFKCVTRGYRKEYQAFCEFVSPDTGKPVSLQPVTFNEFVAETFRKAGHTQVLYQFSQQVKPLAKVDVVLTTRETRRGEVYEIEAICGLDGNTFHKVEYPAAQKPVTNKHEGLKISQRFAKAAGEKAAAKRKTETDKWSAIFAPGEKLIRWQLNENPWYLVEAGTEFMVKKRVARAA